MASLIDKRWIKSKDKANMAFLEGVKNFINFAEDHMDRTRYIKCPCKTCLNNRKLDINDVRKQILKYGFCEKYEVWTHHGEVMQPHVIDTTSIIDEEMMNVLDDLRGNHNAEDVPIENRGYYDALFAEMQTELYPGCTMGSLNFIAKLMHIKVKNKWTNKSFTELLELLCRAFPEGHNLPATFDESKMKLKSLGLGYEIIDVCLNDCAIYWKKNKSLERCPICGLSRWDPKKGKKVAHKKLRYFPLVPRLQRLYASRHTARDMRWHHTGKCSDEDVLRHPVDGISWKNFDERHPAFASEPRNVRLALAADGFNPFSGQNNPYSMWPVILTTYNLPPWICMKDSTFMLTLLIPGPRCPGAQRKKRGPSTLKATEKAKEKLGGQIPIEFCDWDDTYNPITETGKHFARVIGNAIRDYVPKCHVTWETVPDCYKAQIWARLRNYFDVDGWMARDDWAAIETQVKSKSGNLYKAAKHRIKKKHMGKDTKPDGTDDEEWQRSLEMWRSEQFLRRSRAGKENRLKQGPPSGHGSCTLSRTRDKLMEGPVDEETGICPVSNYYSTIGKRKNDTWRAERFRLADAKLQQALSQASASQASGSQIATPSRMSKMDQGKLVTKVAEDVMLQSRGWKTGVGPVVKRTRKDSTSAAPPSATQKVFNDFLEFMNAQMDAAGHPKFPLNPSPGVSSSSGSHVSSTPLAMTEESVRLMIEHVNLFLGQQGMQRFIPPLQVPSTDPSSPGDDGNDNEEHMS